jgi:hypothetical protein
MSNTVKRFRKYSDDIEERHNFNHDPQEYLKEKRLKSALRSKTKSNLLNLIDDEDYNAYI